MPHFSGFSRAIGASVLAAAALVAAGCVSGTQREGRLIAAADVAKIEIGKTTRQQVLDLFGPPTAFRSDVDLDDADIRERYRRKTGADRPVIHPGPGEDIYVYEYWEDHESFISFILIYTWFRRTRYTDTLMVVFDENDRVKNFAFSVQTDSGQEAAKPESEAARKSREERRSERLGRRQTHRDAHGK